MRHSLRLRTVAMADNANYDESRRPARVKLLY